MNAMEKVAWTELFVSILPVAAATLLVPWLGPRAAVSGFAFLGFTALGVAFLRRHGNRVVTDERDREIGRRATSMGVGAAWMTLTMTLITATLWADHTQANSISIDFLSWLICIQAAICYGTKGLVAIVMYRRQRHAA